MHIAKIVRQDVAADILLVQALHDHDDRAGLWVVQPERQRLVEDPDGSLSLGIGRGLFGRERIIPDHRVAAPAGDGDHR